MKKRKAGRSNKSKKISKKKITLIIISILLLSLLIYLFSKTGFLQKSSIDSRDLKKWEHINGIIKGAEEFSFEGEKDTCWLLIHSYASTPSEMKQLAQELNKEFNDYILVPRLEGHGEVPSHIQDKNLDIWYSQIEKEFLSLKQQCNKTNILGSSFGGAITAKLAQNHKIKNTYLINAYFFASSRWYSPFPREVYIKLFSDIILYQKKGKLARINSPEGLKQHIAYWNMPYLPVKHSLTYLEKTFNNVQKINSPLFIAHSRNDMVANKKSAEIINNKANSEIKQLNWYDKSNHILLMDYQKEELIKDIINFEKQNR